MSAVTEEVEVPTAPTASWTRADTLAAAAIAFGVVLTALVGTQLFLRGDDWLLLTIVSRPGFGPSDLFVPYASHVMPFGLSVFWAARAFGGATPWWLLVGTGTALGVIGSIFTWACIRMLVGPRVKAVVPFLLVPLAPSLMTAIMWPSPSVYMTALFAVTAIALWGYLRSRLGDGRSGPIVVTASIVLGLFASELSLLIPPMLFVLGMAWFGGQGILGAAKHTWRQTRAMWVGLVAVMVVYLAVYLALARWAGTLPSVRPSADVVIEGLILVALQTLPAMILGGPWVWNEVMGPVGSLTGPPVFIAALVAWTVIVLGRRARWRVWWPLATVLLLTVLALASARIATYGPTVVRNPYYTLGAVSLLAVTLTVAYLPSSLPIDRPTRKEPGTPVFVGAACLLIISTAVSFVMYSQAVPRTPSRAYLAEARSALTQPTLNVASPRDAFGSFLYTDPWDTSQHTFDLAGVTGDWVTVTEDPYMLDGSGRRVRMTVDGEPFVTPEPCYPIDGRISLTMPKNRDPNWPTFALSYTAKRATTGDVDIAGTTIPIEFTPGDHTVYFVGDGRPPSLTLQADGVCVREFEVGTARPATQD
ncbi:MAG TPA: hypothetical protein PK902_01670 [Actinomycetota bacterium]|nr:hypothetical protein [Actinomycetota bacterium]